MKDDSIKSLKEQGERSKDDKVPRIKVFCLRDNREIAVEVGFGIEEEGVFYEIICVDDPSKKALSNIRSGGIGVSAAVEENRVSIFFRQLKEERPLIQYCEFDRKVLKIAGKNSARIVKRRPLVM